MTRKLLVALILGLATLSARAQEISPLEPPDTSRYLQWGPLRVRPGLIIPTFGYDDNVYAIPNDSTFPRLGTYFVALAPRAEGLVLFKHWAFLTFDEKLEFYLYAPVKNSDSYPVALQKAIEQTNLNYFNQYGTARLTVPFRRIGIYWDFGFNRTRDRPYDAQSIRPIRKEYPLGIGLVTKFGWRTDSEIGVFSTRMNAELSNDPCEAPGAGCATVAQVNNRTESGARWKARYLMFGRTRLLVDVGARKIDFDDPVTAAHRNGDERRFTAGLDFGLGGRIFGNFHVGEATFDLTDPTQADFRGVVADVALGYDFGSSGSRVIVTGTRDVRYSIYDVSPLYLYTGGDATFIKYFNRFIGMEISGGLAALDFLGSDRVDDITTGGAGIRFRVSENDLGRRVEYAFRYTRTKIDSSVATNNQNRGTVGFGVTVGY
ncbi:MAG TPA: outer membrane beta-barrel protein [Candidatus Polarisedimenticolaceae bacterium]|nr:outer membrane beta-barrel protein [Candidatus Polarisedimenticolaceae bacterium]